MFACSSPIVPLCFFYCYPATHPQSYLVPITPVTQQSPEHLGSEETIFIMLAGGGEDETEDINTHTQQWREIPFSI